MKKRVFLIFSMIFLMVCASMSLFGCLGPRQTKLSIKDVYQSSYGSIILIIENVEAIKQDDKVEVSHNGGITWKSATNDDGICGEFNNLYRYSNDELKAGKNYTFVARIAENEQLKAGKKSNAVKLKTKKVLDLDTVNLFGETIVDLILPNYHGYYDQYLLLDKGESLRIDKYEYYYEENGKMKEKISEDDYKLDFEYYVVDKAYALQKYRKHVEEFLDVENNANQQDYEITLAEMAALFMSVDMSISDYAPVVWRDYDWEKGIEKDEEFNKAVFFDGQDPSEFAYVIMRIKANVDTLASNMIILPVELDADYAQ